MRKCLNDLKLYGNSYPLVSTIWIFDHGKCRGAFAFRKKVMCLFYKVQKLEIQISYILLYKVSLPFKHQIHFRIIAFVASLFC